MITAQEIREKAFTKAFNGYNMSEVDEFLDEMAADVSAMAKENAVLNSKMRLLVEKVSEYKQTEDSMRLALMSAQKMSAQIESEAKDKADAMIAEARETANRLTRQATDGIANEEAKLAEAKKGTEKFFEHMRTVCEKQIEFYSKLSQMNLVGGSAAEAAPQKAETKAKEVDDTVKSIETSVEHNALSSADSLTVDTDLPEEEEEPTRLFSADGGAKKKRTFEDFKFDDDI